MYSETMCSDLGLFWQYTTYMFSFRSWKQKGNNFKMIKCIEACTNEAEIVKLKIHCGRTCLRKSGPSLSGSSKHFSNSPRKKLRERERVEREVSYCTSESEQGKWRILHLCGSRTPCASRRSGGCCQTRFCLFPSYHQGHPPPSSDSCSPYNGDTQTH